MQKRELFYAIEKHLLEDERPGEYLNILLKNGGLSDAPFSMLVRLKDTHQPPEHHPEGNVWIHTMMVVDQAARHRGKSRDKRAFMWAALLHDIGKPDTTSTKKGRITAYDHDLVGEKLTRQFFCELTDDEDFIREVAALVRWHMQILFVGKKLPFAKPEKMIKETDYKEIALLGYCDRMGRLGADEARERENIDVFLRKTAALQQNTAHDALQ